MSFVTITDDNIAQVRQDVENLLVADGKAVYVNGDCVGFVTMSPIENRKLFGNSFCLRNLHVSRSFFVGDQVELCNNCLLYVRNNAVAQYFLKKKSSPNNAKPIRMESRDYNVASYQRYLIKDFGFNLQYNLYTNINFADGMRDEELIAKPKSLGEEICYDLTNLVQGLLLCLVPNIPDKVESQLTSHGIDFALVIDWKHFVDENVAYLSGTFNGKPFEDLFDVYLDLATGQ